MNKTAADSIFLSVIIPAYNEERRIARTLLAADLYLARQPYASEIVVVSDGSGDETVAIVQGLQKIIPNLTLLANAENHGKGYVVRQGIRAARGAFRVFSDADNSTSIDHVEKMWPFFREGYGVVIGSRDVKGAVRAVAQSKWKEWLGDLGNIFIQVVAGLWGIWDTQCGFKGFSAAAAEDIFSRTRVYRWGFDVEVLAVAKALGWRVREIPVYWVNDPFTHVKFRAYIQVLWETVKIRWWTLRDVYGIRRRAQGRAPAPQVPVERARHPMLAASDIKETTSPVSIQRRNSRTKRILRSKPKKRRL